MTRSSVNQADPDLDLVMERVVDLPPASVWAAWTQPDLLKRWFTPAPWTTVECEIELYPGGRFHTVMRSPEGVDYPGTGCYLELIENEKLVWTNALAPGFRPLHVPAASADDCNSFLFTAVLTLQPEGQGTRYRALLIHRDAQGRKLHADMGFHQGWGAALDQLVALMQQR